LIIIQKKEVLAVSTSFKDLLVWNASMDYVTSIYEITRDFPDSERFGLASQLQRAAVSVPSNIAEGSGRQHNKEYAQFLYLSKGSLREVITQLEMSMMLGYIDQETHEKLRETADRLHRILNRLIASLKLSTD